MEKAALKLQVAAKNMPEFTKILIENDIDNEIVGHTEDEELIIHVEYGEPQEEAVEDLLEFSEIFEDDFDEEEEED